METKICKACKQSKNIDEYYQQVIKKLDKQYFYYFSECKSCKQEKKQKLKSNNLLLNRICIKCFKEKPLSEYFIYSIKRNDNKYSYHRKVCKTCKEETKCKNNWNLSKEGKEYQRNYRKIYRQTNKNNPNFKLRSNLSRTISRALKKKGSAKDSSFLTKLDYNVNDLRKHLEKQFESWMNWNNYGIYDPQVWDDNNTATWTWNIDHIIPQATLPYSSMEDDNFQKCWALSNLRPLSAKENNQRFKRPKSICNIDSKPVA